MLGHMILSTGIIPFMLSNMPYTLYVHRLSPRIKHQTRPLPTLISSTFRKLSEFQPRMVACPSV